MDVKTLRRELCQKRKQLDQATREEAATKIYWRCVTSPFYRQAQRIACYLAHQGEVDTLRIIRQIWHDRKVCYLPLLDNYQTRQMRFVQYSPQDPLRENTLGIPEPALGNSRITPQDLDLVFMPLVAFDSRGARLGRGAGFYDHSFSFLIPHPRPGKPLLIGLAYDFQQVEMLERNPWDVTLDGVFTETGSLIFTAPDPTSSSY